MSARPFIHDEFLLQNATARRLYHEFAEPMPIIDYHCHLPPDEVARDKRFSNITECWLGGDHYKWRALRSNGVDERFITGDASDWEKFEQWASTMPKLLGNPLYHWTHLELSRYFGIDTLLGPDTAREIFDACNARIASDEFSARQLIKSSNVVAICTTDDPCDSLEHHRAVRDDPSFDCKLLPAWRPDKGMCPEAKDFNDWVDKLALAAGTEISDYESYLAALKNRHDFFHAEGCRLSDHGIETFYADDYIKNEIATIFENVRDGERIDSEDISKFKSAMLYEFAVLDADRGWVQQFHFSPTRNNNRRLFEKLGPDIGCDSISDLPVAAAMSKFLDLLDYEGKLTKTILYNLNPRDNEVVGAMLGNFQDGSVPGKMQMGSGWWFNDQLDGMRRQIECLSQLGLLSRFVGMLTDSRSFLSYTRHEYFRRLLCNILGTNMEEGLLPNDLELVGGMVRDICYNNAAEYFDFGVGPVLV
ncbi:MAG: glucuronate isomerase [Verrucomicrobiales bacterium]